MRKGFTILELLVASLLLGMLMTILTMIFNQSSIAWRTGVAGVANINNARNVISGVRYMADNAHPSMTGKLRRIASVFDSDGEVLQSRGEYAASFNGVSSEVADIPASGASVSDSYKSSVGCPMKAPDDQHNYVVNVMSAGPDGKMDTYDDIWSFPDDPEEWCK